MKGDPEIPRIRGLVAQLAHHHSHGTPAQVDAITEGTDSHGTATRRCLIPSHLRFAKFGVPVRCQQCDDPAASERR
jgi:hypothetical protein